jgi:integrative and conjugative element protein (TIGR02256 family)
MASESTVPVVQRTSIDMLRFRMGDSPQMLVLADEILQHFERHRQAKRSQSEAGGQLFARFDEGEVRVAKVTGPRSTDRRGRTFYRPDRRAEQLEIDELYKEGLHYVGDWHTHPSPSPVPSFLDIESMFEVVARSGHDLQGFILVIVGTEPFPSGLRVSLYSAADELVLCPNAVSQMPEPKSLPRKLKDRLLRKG